MERSYETSWRTPSLGSSKPQRLASSDEIENVALVPQLAHLKSTSRAGDPIVAQCASLTMKDTEPQLWQANPFCSITSCRHRALSPERQIPACYPTAYSQAPCDDLLYR